MDPTTFPHRVSSGDGAEYVVLALFLTRRLAYRFRDLLWLPKPDQKSPVNPSIWVETLTLEGWLRDPD